MPVLDASHDFAHPVEGDTAWSESYYFNAYDPVADAGFFTRIGIRPNEGTMDVGFSVWLPDEDLAQLGGVREQKEMVDEGLSVAGVTYERVEPMRSWHLTAAGVHVLLGASNLVFWPIFVAADALWAGYVTTTLHWSFVALQLIAASSVGANAAAPARA